MSRSTRRPSGDVTPYHAPQRREASPLSNGNGPLVTRRAALKAMLGISFATAATFANPLRSFAAEATQETTDKLNAAQAAYDDAQAKLTDISNQYVQLNQQLNDTVNQIEKVQGQIDDKQSELDDKQSELDDKQEQLSQRISTSYKTGNADFLSVLLNSASFDELTSNLFYMGKINSSDQQLINDVKQAKADLEQAKADLESQKSQLEQLKEEQTTQLQAVQAKQDEASNLVASLSDDVKALIAQRDAEILAAAEEEKRQKEAEEAARKAAEEAAKQQQSSGGSSSSSGGSRPSGVTGSLSGAGASKKGQAIVAACHRVGSPGAGLCAMWVSQVYSAAGLGYPGGNANNMYWNYCTSSDKSKIEPGMIIAVSTHSHTSAGRTYGHVGIYIGNGTVMDNVGYVRTIGLDSWISYYSDTVTPRWGWAG